MISIRVEKRHGNAIVLFRVTAPSIERALEIAGEGARVLFPIDGEKFFVEEAHTSAAREGTNRKVA